MKKEFLKMAGVDNEKDFYKLFPTEAAFFGMYPEAKKLVQKKHGGQALPKAQFGKGSGSSSMVCTSKEGCKIARDPDAWNDTYSTSLFKPNAQVESTPWENLMSNVNSEFLNNYKGDDYNLASEGIRQRFKIMSNPLNQYVDAQGNYLANAPKGEPENFYNLVRGLQKANIFDPKNLSNDSLIEWMKQIETNDDGKKANSFKQQINKTYYKGLPVPSQTPLYFSKGGLVKYQDKGQVIDPEDLSIINQKKQDYIDYLTGRSNFQDPDNPEIAAKIRNEASSLLEQFKQLPNNYDVKYVDPKFLYSIGAAGRYEDDGTMILQDPKFKNREYYFGNKKYSNLPESLIVQAASPYPIGHEADHMFLDKSGFQKTLQKEDNASRIVGALVGPKTFTDLYLSWNRQPTPGLENKIIPPTSEEKRKALGQYTWISGAVAPGYGGRRGGIMSGVKPTKENPDPFPVIAKNFVPTEWAQGRSLLYKKGLDSSKPVTADQLKNIYDETLNTYNKSIEALNNEKNDFPTKKQNLELYHKNSHLLDFFNLHGNDFKKMKELLNSVVKSKNQQGLQMGKFGLQKLPQYQIEGQVKEQPWWMKRPSDISQRGNQNLNTEIAAQRTKEKKVEAIKNRYTIGEDKRTDAQKQKDKQEFERRKKVEEEWYGKDFNTPQYIQDKNRARAEHLIHLADVGSMGYGLVEGLSQLRKFIPSKKIVKELEPPAGKSWDDAIDDDYENRNPDYTKQEYDERQRIIQKEIDEENRQKRLLQQSRDINKTIDFNTDLTPLDSFYTNSSWEEFANDPSMNDLMKTMQIDPTNQIEVEKFRKSFINNYLNMFMNEARKNMAGPGDAYLYNLFYNKNKYGGGINRSKKHFFNRDNFGKLVVGATRPNLKKAQFGLGNLNPLLGLDWTKRWLKNAQEQQKNPPSVVRSVLDPTGYSNYGNLVTAVEQIPKSKGVKESVINTTLALLEGAASLPMVGGAVAPIKGIKALRKAPLLEKALVKGHNALTKVQPIAGIDKRLYAPLYKTAASGAYGFASPIGRGTRFWKGLDGVTNQEPTSSEFIKVRYPNGEIKSINVNSEEYNKIYNSLDENSFNLVDSTFSFKKKK